MPYEYEKDKAWLMTDDGQRALFQVRDNARALLRAAGAFHEPLALKGVGAASTWDELAVLDRLVELGELIVVGAGDHGNRVFVAGTRCVL